LNRHTLHFWASNEKFTHYYWNKINLIFKGKDNGFILFSFIVSSLISATSLPSRHFFFLVNKPSQHVISATFSFSSSLIINKKQPKSNRKKNCLCLIFFYWFFVSDKITKQPRDKARTRCRRNERENKIICCPFHNWTK
jgi:hypothetical protein